MEVSGARGGRGGLGLERAPDGAAAQGGCGAVGGVWVDRVMVGPIPWVRGRDGAWVAAPESLPRGPRKVRPSVEPARGRMAPGGELAPWCACGRRLVWGGPSWRCEACGRVEGAAEYATNVSVDGSRGAPRGLPPGAAVGVPLFRSPLETNCASGATRHGAAPTLQGNREWLDDVEWLSSWHRRTCAARLRARSAGRHSSWHEQRIAGQRERVSRVALCGVETGMEWHDPDTGVTRPHRQMCGCWRLCATCARTRKSRLQSGVTAQRALALATYRDRLQRRYAGREGRWSERLLTVTLRHHDDASGVDLRRDVRALVDAWRAVEAPWRLHLRARGLREPQVYVRAVEVAQAKHAHMHVWLLGPYIEHVLLRAWWGLALRRVAGADVPMRPLVQALQEARDPRTERWLRACRAVRVVDGVECVPWPVLDVRGVRDTDDAVRYVAKSHAALYVVKGSDVRVLDPVHATRVYEALEGVRVSQWASGWAPKRGRSTRWHLRRARARGVSPTGGAESGAAARVPAGALEGVSANRDTDTVTVYDGTVGAGAGPPE